MGQTRLNASALLPPANTSDARSSIARSQAAAQSLSWTPALRRLYSCVSRCVAAGEPVLLVGETGAGKTTVCQLLSLLHRQPLRILNCHAHTETADFLGGYRPTRAAARAAGAPPFAWVDGPLLSTMREGAMLLVDELSLAEDGVLERLNSVLEPGRSITLAERAGDAAGGADVETVVAALDWRLLATMNPGGDFGKRELSPALRNRFTEVWVPTLTDREDVKHLIAPRLGDNAALAPLADALADFWCVHPGRACAVHSALSVYAGPVVHDDKVLGRFSFHSQSRTQEFSLLHAWRPSLRTVAGSSFLGCLKRMTRPHLLCSALALRRSGAGEEQRSIHSPSSQGR